MVITQVAGIGAGVKTPQRDAFLPGGQEAERDQIVECHHCAAAKLLDGR